MTDIDLGQIECTLFGPNLIFFILIFLPTFIIQLSTYLKARHTLKAVCV